MPRVPARRLLPALLIGFSLTALPGCGGSGGSSDGGGDSTGDTVGTGGGGGSDDGIDQKADCDGGRVPSQNDGSVVVSWTAPQTYTDGTSLSMSDVGSYVVYCGTAKQDLEKKKAIQDRTQTSYSLTNLPPGTYYVAVSAADTAGLEGPKSNVVSATVQ